MKTNNHHRRLARLERKTIPAEILAGERRTSYSRDEGSVTVEDRNEQGEVTWSLTLPGHELPATGPR